MSKITKFRQRFATFKLQLISHNIHTFPELLIYLSCFIFCYKVIEYQTFRKVKHTTFMFHFYFQCFILKTLREKNKNTVGAIQNPCGSDSKTLRERESAPSVF